MDKKYNIVSGIHIDPRSQHRSLVASTRPELSPEPKFSISELPQEPLFLTFPISLVLKELSMPFNSRTESVEILSIWPKREPTSSQLFMMLENPLITGSSSVWLMSSSLTSPNPIRPESFPKIVTCTLKTAESS